MGEFCQRIKLCYLHTKQVINAVFSLQRLQSPIAIVRINEKIQLLILLFFIYLNGTAQKVGVVFSGGGAKGLAHIGVLKALEENNIPIDYIVGTSMGGVVGAMYAAGYTPQEIERIAVSTNFQDWVSGKFDSDYRYFFQKNPTTHRFYL